MTPERFVFVVRVFYHAVPLCAQAVWTFVRIASDQRIRFNEGDSIAVNIRLSFTGPKAEKDAKPVSWWTRIAATQWT